MARRFAAVALLGLALAAPAHGAFGHSGRWLTTSDGRVFVPHGVDLIATRAPYFPSWFGEDDARLLAREGFTVVRLLLMPAALEPTRGKFDPAYLKQFTDRIALLARYGIATVLAVNQDGYTEACGGDGFPAWMLVGPCDDRWEPFWENDELDGRGLQDRYLDWWRYLAPRVAGLPSVLGLDLLNEPDAPDEEALDAFWKRTVAAVGSLTSRVVFAEPGPPGSPGFRAVVPAGTGYEPHLYCWDTLRHAFGGKLPSQQEIARCVPELSAQLKSELAFATRNGYPFFVGEFGASDELQEQTRIVDALGESFAPWAAYAYTSRLDSSGTPTQSLLRDDRKPASEANAKARKLDALVVPYPVTVAGTPTSWSYDRTTPHVRFAYSTRPVGKRLGAGAQTVVFVPQRAYPHGYAATAGGATIVSRPGAAWLRLRALPGASSVTVAIRSRADATTRTPLDDRICGYDLRPCGSR